VVLEVVVLVVLAVALEGILVVHQDLLVLRLEVLLLAVLLREGLLVEAS
jgi:hypothetical protein